MNQINIEEQSTTYNVTLAYHSDIKNKEYNAAIVGIEEADGRITLRPKGGETWENEFVFVHSDPDRVIALAQMMLGFAQMVKNENKKNS